MWNAPLYAVNMLYYHWLIKMLLWPMAEGSQAAIPSRETGRKKTEVRRCQQPLEEEEARALPRSSYGVWADAQIIRNGLIICRAS